MKAFYVVWTLWFVFEVLLNRITKSKNIKKQKDKGSLNILWIAILFGISLGVLFMYNYNLPFSKNLSVPYIGLVVIILGIIIRLFAILSLKKSFTVDVSVKTNQKIITKGIYKIVRHPAYLGNIISFIGLGLSFNNIASLFIILISVVYAFLYRIKVEEKVLIENFGDEYVSYMKKTKKLFPFVF